MLLFGYLRNGTNHRFKHLKPLLMIHMMGVKRAGAVGLLTQLQIFQFIVLWVFSDIVGVTKSTLTLQGKDIDLATEIDQVESVEKTLTERRSRDYFHQKICALKDAGDNNVKVSSTQEK